MGVQKVRNNVFFTAVERTHQEHVQLVEIDTPEVTHVDSRAYTEPVKQVKNRVLLSSKSVRNRWMILNGYISSDKSAKAS